jgi:hypothetical protein
VVAFPPIKVVRAPVPRLLDVLKDGVTLTWPDGSWLRATQNCGQPVLGLGIPGRAAPVVAEPLGPDGLRLLVLHREALLARVPRP